MWSPQLSWWGICSPLWALTVEKEACAGCLPGSTLPSVGRLRARTSAAAARLRAAGLYAQTRGCRVVCSDCLRVGWHSAGWALVCTVLSCPVLQRKSMLYSTVLPRPRFVMLASMLFTQQHCRAVAMFGNCNCAS
jgi:hypothetical protein